MSGSAFSGFYQIRNVWKIKHCGFIKQMKKTNAISKRHINSKHEDNFVFPCLSRDWRMEPQNHTTTTYSRGMVTSPRFCSDSSRFVQGNIINGKVLAKEIREELRAEVDTLVKFHPKQRKPHLSVILVGNDPASIVYVRNKARAATETGISCDILRLPHAITGNELREELQILNKDETVDGILVQLPLPRHMSERYICDSVLPEKDVDGFNVLNIGRFLVDQKAFIPATPLGVLEILKRLKIETCGKNAVVCGRSKNVGLPIALYLQGSRNGDTNSGNASVTICHRYTPSNQLRLHTQNADILITATGVPRLVTADMVKEGAVVIDIGISRVKDSNGKYRLVGDVDFEGVKPKASLITPVPGGVGPVTVAMVLKNTLTAYKKEINFYQSGYRQLSTSHS